MPESGDVVWSILLKPNGPPSQSDSTLQKLFVVMPDPCGWILLSLFIASLVWGWKLTSLANWTAFCNLAQHPVGWVNFRKVSVLPWTRMWWRGQLVQSFLPLKHWESFLTWIQVDLSRSFLLKIITLWTDPVQSTTGRWTSVARKAIVGLLLGFFLSSSVNRWHLDIPRGPCWLPFQCACNIGILWMLWFASDL